MMNMMMGFLESYLLGLAPSRMPPCFAAREAAVAATAALAVTVAVTVERIVLAIPQGYGRALFSNLWVAPGADIYRKWQLGWIWQASAAS